MWALHPNHEQPTKLIMSLPTFNGRAHLPTHVLHYYMQAEDWPIAPKKMKLWKLLKIKGFYFDLYSSSPWAHLYR
jgi:hypothetical protein